MNNASVNIYLVSMERDVERRKVIANQFPKHFANFNIIEAVDGQALDTKSYFSYLSNYYNRTKKVITPTELGCTLSHMTLLEKFLASDATHALIFEDDVIGNDKLLEQAVLLRHIIPTNALLILGCQDGLTSVRWLYGKLIKNNTYKIFKFFGRYLCRSCAYLVSKESAKFILNKHNKNIALADDFSYLIHQNLYFSNVFAHPIEYKSSNIESERLMLRDRSWLGTVCSFNYRIVRFFYLKLLVFFVLILGYKKVKLN